MFKRIVWLTTAALLFFGASQRSLADTTTFVATMNGASETPPNNSPGTGNAVVTLSGNLLTVVETFSGLTAPASAAHIHCCAPPGTAAPVVVPFAGFPSATSGIFTESFDLSTFSFSGGLNETQFLTGLESGLAYVNIHDVNFPGGEIRGQLEVSPEPASLWLLGTTTLGAVALLRRKRLGSR